MGLQDLNAERMWRNVMLWCLKYSRRHGLMLLLATLKGRKIRPPRYVVSDCLNFLARHFLFAVSNPNTLALDAIWLLTCKFIDGASNQEQNFPVPQHLVYLVIKNSDDARVLSFYGLLGLNRALLDVNTMLHFLDRFMDMGRINLSMNLLGTIATTNFDLRADQVQWGCVKLLRARFDTPEEYTARSNILTRILEMGIRPSVVMLNAILLNAGEGGDFANAWQMYVLAKENALIPDTNTYGVLLKGAILSGDLSKLGIVIREIQKNGEALQDIGLVGYVLNAIGLSSPGDEFGSMLDFYKQHCDLRPLQELSLCGEETKAPPGANCHGIWPNSYILNIMIMAYVRLHQGSSGLINNYNLYYLHVQENHPLIAPLAQTDLVANCFILAFGRYLRTLQHCITVIRHMLEFSSPNIATFDTVPYAAPTVRTWSLLVSAYFRHRQPRAAEKVLDMMHERGIRGDSVTWNTLVRDYADMRDVDAAVDAVKKMVAAGFEVDAYTVKSLEKLSVWDNLGKALTTSMEKLHVNTKYVAVLPLNSDEQFEANIGHEWGSTSLNRGQEVRKYLKARNEDINEDIDREMEMSSDIPPVG